MATQVIDQAPTADAAADAPAAKGGRMVLILAIAGVVAGLGAGFFGVGPVLAKKKAATHAAPKKEEKVEASVNHAIENIVLNPAGSGGAHFLMVTATFELKDGAAEEFMKSHEAEIRDRLLALFGKRTVEELTEISAREVLKKEVLENVAPLFPKGAVQKVFFPQFVIQ